jgi:hypothetical protein
MIDMIETYADLLGALQRLSPQQLQQKAQVVMAGHSDDREPVILQPCIAVGTVEDFFETDGEGNKIEPQIVRDSSDGRHKSESVAILTDISGYEDISVYVERRKMRSILEKIVQGKTGTADVKEFVRVELDKIDKKTEKKKEKILKECA